MIKKSYLVIISYIFLLNNLFATNLFDNQELEYIKNKKSITICSVSNFMPYEDFDKDNNHIGFTKSYFKLFQDILKLPIKVIKTKDIKQSFDFLKLKKCDAVSLVQNPIKNQQFIYTTPYIISPLVIAIRSKVPFITDFNNLQDKTFGIVKNSVYKDKLLEIYPNINHLIEVNSIKDGLHKVDNKQLFGQIGTLADIGYLFYQDFMGELKIAGKTDNIELKFKMGFLKDDKVLVDIFQKIIDNLDKSVHYNIVSRWTSISYGKGIPRQLVIKFSIIFLVIFLAIILFIFLLKRKIKFEVEKNKQKDKYLLHQSRLAQMGKLLNMIAHQWRQPLGSINSVVIDMQLNVNNSKFDKSFHKINKYVSYLSNTIDNFMSFYKPSNKKILVDVTLPILNALEIIEQLLKAKNINIITNFKSYDKIYMYNNELVQVILTIVHNSVDNFILKDIQNPQITIDTYKIKDKYYIAISDNGKGIDENIIDNIFDPYFSTKDEKNNTGLGLYMSKMIIEEYHNGKLDVKNIKDGVSFIIELIVQ